jgi:hypothetical protein
MSNVAVGVYAKFAGGRREITQIENRRKSHIIASSSGNIIPAVRPVTGSPSRLWKHRTTVRI